MRVVGAGILGVGAGAGAFAVLVLAGALVYQRLWGGGSLIPLIVIGVVAVSTGLYAGWLVGMLVFSAVRGGDEADAEDGTTTGSGDE
jgi:fatty acid desaturase